VLAVEKTHVMALFRDQAGPAVSVIREKIVQYPSLLSGI
jgi:hypothetical protein